MKNWNKILISNRGEIAVRIIRAAKELGIKTVAIYHDDEKNALFNELADESYSLGNGNVAGTYLNIDKILHIAKLARVQAIHPGYGFLSENHHFAKACHEAGITFIGPSPETIRAMGNKIESRQIASKAGVPVTKSMTGTPQEIISDSNLKFPLLIKAAAGGGGRGMHIVRHQSELKQKLEQAQRESLNYFGSDEVYVEQYIEKARHIEVQVIGDTFGNIVHLFERECSLQRKFQKVIEEAPSPSIDGNLREKIVAAAVKIAQQVQYINAGTVEFIVDTDNNFYFLEMNTRLQVEHPVTEEITGIDIVKEQFRIAMGHSTGFTQQEIKKYGHAIEARICAEAPFNDFQTSAGEMDVYKLPKEKVRIDSGFSTAGYVPPQFDSLISKVTAYGISREEARLQLIQALQKYHISGIKTNKEFLIHLLQQKNVIENDVYTKFIEHNIIKIQDDIQQSKQQIPIQIPAIAFSYYTFIKQTGDIKNIWEQIGFWRNTMTYTLKIDNNEIIVKIIKSGAEYQYQVNGDNYSPKLEHAGDNFFVVHLHGHKYEGSMKEKSSYQASIFINEHEFNIETANVSDYESIFESLEKQEMPEIKSAVKSPIFGRVMKIHASKKEKVKKGELLLIIESMKTENHITSPVEGIIKEISVSEGSQVKQNDSLIVFDN
jgi:3-methylcrotonyl-CoA carboxylase alpha subunit